MGRWWVAALMAVVLLLGATGAQAAEVLQVRSGTLLQVGDHNRTYTVELACVAIPEGGNLEATEWLRAALPRRTKVNLRPVGNDAGTLVARAEARGVDLSGLTLAEMQAVEPRITQGVFDVLTVEASVRSRTSYGGTAPANVAAMAAEWKAKLA